MTRTYLPYICRNLRKSLHGNVIIRNIAVPNTHCNSGNTYYNRNMAGSLSGHYSLSSECLATLRKGLVSFCVHIKHLSDLCQTLLKAFEWGITVPATHLLHTPGYLRAGSCTERVLFV